MKGNKWLVIEDGRLARGPFDDARARADREALAATWDASVERAMSSLPGPKAPVMSGPRVSEPRASTITDDDDTSPGREVFPAPVDNAELVSSRSATGRSLESSSGTGSVRGVAAIPSTKKRANVKFALPRSSPHALLCPSSGEPVYPQDEAGFEAATAFDGDQEFADAAEARDRPFRPAPRDEGVSLWRDRDVFDCAATADREREVTRLVSRTVRSKPLHLVPAAATPPSPESMPGSMPGDGPASRPLSNPSAGAGGRVGMSVWVLLLATLAMFALVLLSKGLGGRLRGSLGFVTDPEETNALVADTSRTSVGGTTLAALAPEPLRAFEEVVRAKLERDPAGYAKALLRLDASRHGFPPQSLPSRAFIAAMAMHTMSDEQLDPNPRWRAFLEKLGAERSQGIGVVGYEQSRVRKAVAKLLADLQRKGVPNASERGLEALWGVGTGGSARTGRDAEKVLDDVVSSLSRMEKVFSSVAENERLFRNILTAHAVADAVTASWFVDAKPARKMMEARLARLAELVDLVPRPERDLLAAIVEERRKALTAGKVDPKVLASARIEVLLRLQDEGKALCDLRENALMPDYFLQTLRIVRAAGIAPKTVAPWQTCFLAAKPFQAVEKFSFDGNAETAMLAFVPRLGPMVANMRAHESAFRGSNPFEKLLATGTVAAAGAEAGWHAIAFLSGVSVSSQIFPPKSPWPLDAFNEKCGSKSRAKVSLLDPELCAQLSFRLANAAAERLDLLGRVQEDYPPADLAHAAFGVAADLYTGRLLSPSGKKGVDEGAFQKLGFAQYFGATYPEFAALEWHIKNGDSE